MAVRHARLSFSIALLCTILRAGAADTVMTLIDKASDQSPEAYFYKVALGQTDAGAFKERSVQGPLYFVDTNSHCLHNWTQSGGLQHFAGDCGQKGYKNGHGSEALFMLPKGLCLSPLGFLAVVDSGNACVRKVSLDGHVSTLAGTCGHPGEADGDADSAFFSTGIEDIACQQDCTLFVTDRGNRKVRTIHLDEQACPTPPGPTKSEGGLHTGAAVSLGVGTFLACALISGLSFATNKFVAKRIAEKRAATAAAPHCSDAATRVDDIAKSWHWLPLPRKPLHPAASHKSTAAYAPLPHTPAHAGGSLSDRQPSGRPAFPPFHSDEEQASVEGQSRESARQSGESAPLLGDLPQEGSSSCGAAGEKGGSRDDPFGLGV